MARFLKFISQSTINMNHCGSTSHQRSVEMPQDRFDHDGLLISQYSVYITSYISIEGMTFGTQWDSWWIISSNVNLSTEVDESHRQQVENSWKKYVGLYSAYSDVTTTTYRIFYTLLSSTSKPAEILVGKFQVTRWTTLLEQRKSLWAASQTFHQGRFVLNQ